MAAPGIPANYLVICFAADIRFPDAGPLPQLGGSGGGIELRDHDDIPAIIDIPFHGDSGNIFTNKAGGFLLVRRDRPSSYQLTTNLPGNLNFLNPVPQSELKFVICSTQFQIPASYSKGRCMLATWQDDHPLNQHPSFGTQLAATRKARGLSQQQLAESLGISVDMLTYYERRAKNPSADIVARAAGLLGVTSDDLIGSSSKARKKSGPPSQIEQRLTALRQLPRDKQKVVLQLLASFLPTKPGGAERDARCLTLRGERGTPDGREDAIEPRRGALAAAPRSGSGPQDSENHARRSPDTRPIKLSHAGCGA
jgi:transcriptional regulator with XRE-family HTH domain